jgi:uncharacterized membrane protein YhaH (DUF805 family)
VLVLDFHRRLSRKGFVYLLLVLTVIAVLLFMVFTFLATAEVGEVLALISFLAVAGLLIEGYMVGTMVLGLVAIVLLMKYVGGSSEQGTSRHST